MSTGTQPPVTRVAGALTLAGALLVTAVLGSSCGPPASASRPERITIVGGNSGLFEEGLAEALSARNPDLAVTAKTSVGSPEKVEHLQRGTGDLAVAQADVVYLAYRRGTDRVPVPHTALRGIAVLWVNQLRIVVPRDSAIRSIKDLADKRIGVGLDGSSSEMSARIVLEGHGLPYASMHRRSHPLGELYGELQRGTIDAAIVTSRSRSSQDIELNRSRGIRILPVDDPVIDLLRVKYPFLRPMRIPADALAGQPEAKTLGADALLVCRKDLSDDLVYRITKEFFNLLPQLMDDAALASLYDREEAPATPIPLHPGAARYYREQEILR